jgi:hypothetical protein
MSPPVGTELFEFICNENEKSRQHMAPHIKPRDC